MSYKFEVQSGNTVKFPVKGKYCDRDIEVTATGGGGTVLPNLANPAAAEQIVEGYDAINDKGAVVTGTNPYEKTATDEEVNTQANLIEQLTSILEGKAAGGGITVSSENLHDVSTDLANVYIEKGTEVAYNGWNATDYIPTKADKYYFVYSPVTVQGSWSARYGADKVYRGTLPATCSCTSKTSPFLLEGHDGYVRFSGTKVAITPIEVYEVSGFVWEVNG